MSLHRRFFGGLVAGLVVLASGCHKKRPDPQSHSTPSASARAAAAVSAVTASAAPSTPPTKMAPARQATALDEAGQRAAKSYLAALAAGRQATRSKDFARAEEQFSKCLEVLPEDARALAERGFARLLANRLPEAEADLAIAARRAPSSAVLLQILHNRGLVARRGGDEAAAARFEEERRKLEAARRLPGGVTCTSEVTASELAPRVASSIDEALALLRGAHAADAKSEPVPVVFEAHPDGGRNEAERLQALASAGPLPDGAWTLWSTGPSIMNHVLISHAGKLYAFPHLSSGGFSLCGPEGLAEITVGGGGSRPWFIQRTRRKIERGYMDMGGGETMGYCGWASTETDVTLLDAKTFSGIRTLSASAHTAEASAEPEHLLELEWQADKVVVEACGQRSLVSYAAN